MPGAKKKKRQANTTAALLSNWETVEAAIQSSANSMGSADIENQKFLNSIEGHLQQFQAQYQATTTSILDSEFLKGAVDTGSGILGAIQWLTENLGSIPGLIAPIISLLGSTQNFNIFSTLTDVDGSKQVVGPLKRFREASESLRKQTAADIDMLNDYFSGGKTLKGADFEEAFSSGSSAVREYARNINVAEMSTEQLNNRTKEFAQQQEKLNSLGSRFGNFAKNFGASLVASLASMGAIMALTGVISLVAAGFDKFSLSASEAATITSDVTTAYQQSTQEIDSNIAQVEQLRERYEELSQGVSDTGRNISLSTSEYEEYRDIVSQITELSPGIIQGYNAEGDAIIDRNNAIQQSIDLLKQQRIEEARNSVYGGTWDNDGGKTNFEAAFINFDDQFKSAQRDIQSAASDIGTAFQDIYADALREGDGTAPKIQQAIEDAIGITYEDFNKNFAEEFGSSADMSTFIGQNFEAIADNLPQIINNLGQMGGLTRDVEAQTNALWQSYSSAESAVDATANSLRTMMQALFESNEGYYELGESSQNFLTAFKDNISADSLRELGSEGVLALSEALINGLEDNSHVRSAAASMYDLLADRDSIPVDEVSSRMRDLSNAISSELGIDVDFTEIFGLEEFEARAAEIAASVSQTFQDALSGVTVEGTVDG